MEDQLRIVMAGGGTGGHLFPALSIAGVLKDKYQAQVTFFGTERGIESRIVPAKGYHLVLLPVRGFQRRFTLQNFLFPFRLFKSIRISKRKLRTFKPHLIIGTGGYVMGPVIKAAKKLGIPYVLQEQNSYPGVTTRLAAADAEMIFLAYDEAKKYLKNAKQIIVSGNPVFQSDLADQKDEHREFAELKSDLKVILIFGGSQGSVNINRAIQTILKENGVPAGFQILWQTGMHDFERIKKKLKINGSVTLTPFIENMRQAYKMAEFAICRAGAMTISELIKHRLPAIYVPLKSAAANHQYKNALEVQKIDGGRVLEDDERLLENLSMAIKTYTSEPTLLKDMSANLQKLNRGDALEIIMDGIKQTLLIRKSEINLRSKNDTATA